MTPDVQHSMNVVDLALSWRQRHGYAGRGGFVVVAGGEVQCWLTALRDPGDWQLDTVAVDEDGQRWETVVVPRNLCAWRPWQDRQFAAQPGRARPWARPGCCPGR